MPPINAATWKDTRENIPTRSNVMSLVVALYLLVRDTFFFAINFISQLIAYISLLISDLL